MDRPNDGFCWVMMDKLFNANGFHTTKYVLKQHTPVYSPIPVTRSRSASRCRGGGWMATRACPLRRSRWCRRCLQVPLAGAIRVPADAPAERQNRAKNWAVGAVMRRAVLQEDIVEAASRVEHAAIPKCPVAAAHNDRAVLVRQVAAGPADAPSAVGDRTGRRRR